MVSYAFAINSLLISGFDAFNGASGNNSQVTAKNIVNTLKSEFPDKEIVFCQLRTVYHKATETLIDCANSMNQKPDLIISLGEAFCNKAKLETRAYNWLSGSADNDGIQYNGTQNDDSFPKFVSQTIDWRDAYCALDDRDKNDLLLSNDAGSFVCNETLFNMNAKYSEFNMGFIHVPQASCGWRGNRKRATAQRVVTNILRNLLQSQAIEKFSFPTNKNEAKELYNNATNACDKDFFRRLKSSF